MLTITSQYALRALTHLARQAGEPVLGRDLAQSGEVPANYLSKVMLTLRNAGLVDPPFHGVETRAPPFENASPVWQSGSL